MKYLDENGLLYLVQKIKGWDAGKVDTKTGWGLSQNDLTNDLKSKYDTAVQKVDDLTATGGAPNVIEIVKVNGTALTPDSNKAVNVSVPTKLSQLTNDDNFVKDANYVHTDNNFTLTEKQKLAGLENYNDTEIKQQIANAGKIDIVKVNGVEQTVTNKAVEISVPTNNSQLANGAGYQTASDVNALIATALGEVQGLSISIVQTLPETGEAGVLYFVSNPSGKNPNSYDEYIWLGDSYEKIGAIDLDLTGYIKSSDVAAITNAEIDNIIA
jgi:hypothetical protein